MMNEIIAIYYEYALAYESNNMGALYFDDLQMLAEWVETNKVKNVKILRDKYGNFFVTEKRCPVCNEYATCLLVSVTYE